MISTECQVLVSLDDPPKVLKSADDKVLAQCGTCNYHFRFEVNVDQFELDAGGWGGWVFRTIGSGGVFELNINYDDSRWEFGYPGSPSTAILVSFDPLTFADTWHTIEFIISVSTDGTISGSLSIDGSSNTWTNEGYGGSSCVYNLTGFKVGAEGQDFLALRSFRNVSVGDDSGFYDSFNFVGDSFSSFVGGASVVGSELQINQPDFDSAYAQFDWDMSSWGEGYPTHVFICCCRRNVTEISTITVHGEWAATDTVDPPGFTPACALSTTGSRDRTYARIDHNVDWDNATPQFKLFFDGSCQLMLISKLPDVGVGSGFGVDFTNAFSFDCATNDWSGCGRIAPDDCLGGPNIPPHDCEDYLWNGLSSTSGGGLGIGINQAPIFTIDLSYSCGGSFQCYITQVSDCARSPLTSCGIDGGGGSDSTLGIPFTYDDVSGITGTYTVFWYR